LELRRMTDAMRRGHGHIAEMQKQQASLDKLIAGAPLVASELGEMGRDADVLRAKVASLVSKKAEAEITADLEVKSGPNESCVPELNGAGAVALLPIHTEAEA